MTPMAVDRSDIWSISIWSLWFEGTCEVHPAQAEFIQFERESEKWIHVQIEFFFEKKIMANVSYL